MHVLHLKVAEFVDPHRWRWVLTEPGGKFLADHWVAIDPSEPEYAAFLGLDEHLAIYAAPDRRFPDEERIISQVGAWIGQTVLGPVAASILEYGTPVTVRVVVPQNASGLLYAPLELVHVRGRPLALQDVSLVFEVEGDVPSVRPQPMRDRLRMLAVFSLPTDISALGLRRERYELKRLIDKIAQTYGLAIELRVLQYGVTRKALRDFLEEDEGWDVMHFSGHGLAGNLVLESADGTHDLVKADELVEMLRPARGRLKLVTLSACLSAANTIEETLHWLGITAPESAELSDSGDGAPQEEPSAVAVALVRKLDCAALAMRFPVGDDFAVALAARLYEGMFAEKEQLTRALQLALPKALSKEAHPGVPPLSVATPALFGRQAVDLVLQAPSSAGSRLERPVNGRAYFPPEPERFVGRVGAMSRASSAMAPESGKTGILFHGMAGAGKTTCALELAYRYETGRFSDGLVWYEAPREGEDTSGALAGFASAFEMQLRDEHLNPLFPLVHIVEGDRSQFEACLPELRRFLEENSVLVVLDNLESLLTSTGDWRDPRWGQLMTALVSHRGSSRTVMTSRRRPAALEENGLRAEPVHALSLGESALLCRELPNLARLLSGASSAGLERGRRLVTRMLEVVQGHPKLIELAEGQASDPDVLEGHLEQAFRAWEVGESQLQDFFTNGESAVEAGSFLAALESWTKGVVASLPPESRTLFYFLCSLEKGDRLSTIVGSIWGSLWERLARPGDAPDLEAALDPLTAAGMVETWRLAEWLSQYSVHPGLADAGRRESGSDFQAAVDTELGDAFQAAFDEAVGREREGMGRTLIVLGQNAMPYLMRQQRWAEASVLFNRVVARDSSARTAAAVLPMLRRIAAASRDTDRELIDLGVLASALAKAGQMSEAEEKLRQILSKAAGRGQSRAAATATMELAELLHETGRTEEALAMAQDIRGHIGNAGLGPWTQLANEVTRLRLLNSQGRYEEVLSAVQELRDQMRGLPEEVEQEEEAVIPWNVREQVLDLGRSAAALLGRWESALLLNADVVSSKVDRDAPLLDVARQRFSDYFPLLSLSRYEEGRDLVHACRAVFEAEGDMQSLGRAFGALAQLEDDFGHAGEAIALQRTALRYTYLASDPEDWCISHYNLSIFMNNAGKDPKTYLAHGLAAAVIRVQTDSARLATSLRQLASDFGKFAPETPPLPASFDEICQIVEQVEGVYFRERLESQRGLVETGDEALQTVLELVAQEPRRSHLA